MCDIGEHPCPECGQEIKCDLSDYECAKIDHYNYPCVSCERWAYEAREEWEDVD